MSNNANQQNAGTALEAVRMGVEFELLLKYDRPLFTSDGKTPWKQKASECYTAFQKDMIALPDKKILTEAAFRRKMAGSLNLPDEWQWKCSDVAAYIQEKWESSKNKRMIPLDMVNCLAPFSKKPLLNSPDPRTRDVDPDYTKWSITRDYAIECPLDRYGDLFSFEIIGPVMDLSSKDRNTQAYAVCAFYELFNFLTGKDEASCGLEIYASSISTSTHFHVSPPKTIQWSVDQVRRIMCSAYFWDPCVRYLLPAWRRLRDYAPDSRSYPKSAQLYPKPEEALKFPQFIAGRFPRSTWDDPAKDPPYLKCTQADIKYNLDNFFTGLKDIQAFYDFHKKKEGSKVGWNVANLVVGPGGKVGGEPLGTVEFRRPPASMSWFEAVCWLDLTYAMIRAACEKGTPDELMQTWPPEMQTFQAWLKPYRLISTLEVYPALDSKFTRAISQSDQLRLYLTDAEEAALEQARVDYRKEKASATTGSMSAGQVQEAAAETFSKCAQELINSRGIEVNNTLAHPKEQLDAVLKLVKSRMQAEMNKPETMIF